VRVSVVVVDLVHGYSEVHDEGQQERRSGMFCMAVTVNYVGGDERNYCRVELSLAILGR